MVNKKIIYISNMRLPNERPHGIQIMQTCAALKRSGVDIELWVAGRKEGKGKNTEQIFNFYGIKNRFNIKRVSVLDFLPSWWKIGFYLESISFFISTCWRILRLKEDFIVYTRDEIVLFLCFLVKKRIFWESHKLPQLTLLMKGCLNGVSGIITITQNLKNLIMERFEIGMDKILVAHDAVNLEDFSHFISRQQTRKALGLPLEKKIILYAGGLFRRKGIFTLLQSALLFGSDYLFVIVGGNPGDETVRIKKLIVKKSIRNVKLVGHVSHQEIPNYLAAADVLVLPNSNLDKRTKLFTSPLKLFEYMSSNRPIVASETPTIKEVLRDKFNAVLVEPDNPKSLAGGIKGVLQDRELAGRISKQAFVDAQNYTWQKRAEKILNFIKKKCLS
jgi:glycosyltransferase involved in cell wall biosynthesis